MRRVSVIIPTYNRSEYVRQSIESALGQDYPDLEVIVIDDCSTDDTPEVCREYEGDERFTYYRNTENLGMAPNWKVALYDYATGDWAMVLGDDDYLLDMSYLSKAMALAAEDDDIVLVHANVRILYDNSQRTFDTNKDIPRIADGKWMFLNYEYAVYGTRNYGQTSTLFDRHKAMEIGFFQQKILSPDRESFLKITLLGKIGFVSDVASVYRIHGQNVSYRSGINKFFDSLPAITNPYEFARERGLVEPGKLERWKRRMIRQHAEIILTRKIAMAANKADFLGTFIRGVYKDYPFALVALLKLLSPRVLARLLLSYTPFRKKAISRT